MGAARIFSCKYICGSYASCKYICVSGLERGGGTQIYLQVTWSPRISLQLAYKQRYTHTCNSRVNTDILVTSMWRTHMYLELAYARGPQKVRRLESNEPLGFSSMKFLKSLATGSRTTAQRDCEGASLTMYFHLAILAFGWLTPPWGHLPAAVPRGGVPSP